QHSGKPVAQEDRRLGGVPYGELVGAAVPIGDDAARFDRRRGAVVVEEAAGDQMVGARTGGGVVAPALPRMGGDIAAHVLVDAGASVIERLFEIDDRRQRIELDADV